MKDEPPAVLQSPQSDWCVVAALVIAAAACVTRLIAGLRQGEATDGALVLVAALVAGFVALAVVFLSVVVRQIRRPRARGHNPPQP